LFDNINTLDYWIYFIGIEGPITRKVFVDLIEAFQRGQVSRKCLRGHLKVGSASTLKMNAVTRCF